MLVGLGNPGPRYKSTRHNVGFDAVDHVAQQLKCEITKIRHNALEGNSSIAGYSILLVKPQTFMNNSGLAVAAAAKYFHIYPQRIIVCYDDTALNVGALRIRKGGSAGGHNGVASVIEHLGTDEFTRIRFGIGKRPEGVDLADYVLSTLPPDEKKLISDNFQNIVPALEYIVTGKTDVAMSLFNKTGEPR
ncbi:MAG: aminoacyl-tRNA hydrolase [Clostridia bacterium]|nr:aminoacyl-tRNA hydrolase [Clostridia bacterium]